MGVGEKSVMVLIPAYNEAETIFATVRAAREMTGVTEVVVVDDGSRDATADLAGLAGATVLVSPKNRGKGQALNQGLQLFHQDVLLLLDGDLAASAADAARLLAPVLAGEADMTIARFAGAAEETPVNTAASPGGKKGWGLVTGIATWGIRLLTGIRVKAPLSGQRALSKKVVDSLSGFASGFGVEVALTIDIARKGYKIMEVDTQLVHHGATGKDLAGVLHRGRQFLHVAGILLQRMGRLSGA